MKCIKKHTKEEMDKKEILKLPSRLRGQVLDMQYVKCPIDNSDVMYELTDFNPIGNS